MVKYISYRLWFLTIICFFFLLAIPIEGKDFCGYEEIEYFYHDKDCCHLIYRNPCSGFDSIQTFKDVVLFIKEVEKKRNVEFEKLDEYTGYLWFKFKEN